MKSILITTTLPYVNSEPHIGHAFEFVLGDVITRIYRQHLAKEYQVVFFNVGLDEHGIKVWQKAQELGITPEKHIDNMTSIWKKFCVDFNIKYDNFYKTSEMVHMFKSQLVWEKLFEAGYIYKKHYNGVYCKGCESYKKDKDLINGRCPDHDVEDALITIEEENYFFSIDKFKYQLLEMIELNENFIQPHDKRVELINVIHSVEEISISRLKKNCPWGVEVPGDEEQIMYVWFEALLNYIFTGNSKTELNFNWNKIIQICGPDNLRFQGDIFQGLLAALGLKYTDEILVHGTILDESGKKMSKTVGNTVDPMKQLEKYGIDAVRYYCVAGLHMYNNSSWREEDLVNKFNADICDAWGNLVARTLHLLDTKCNGEVGTLDESFQTIVADQINVIVELLKELKIKDAYFKLNELVKFGNLYINEKKPWALTEEGCRDVITNLDYLIWHVNILYAPIFPITGKVVSDAIIAKKKVIAFQKIKLC